MKKISLLLIIIVLIFFISCGGNSDSQQNGETIAPDSLTDVKIKLQNEGDGVGHYLTLNNDGSAELYYRPTNCCWDIDYGDYTYEREDDDTGIVSVSYTYTESYSTSLVDSQSIDIYVEYVLYFDDEVSGSFSEISEEDNNMEGTFTIENIE